MAVERYDGASTEYQGTSFTRTLIKKDKTIWSATNIGTFVLIDSTGAELISRPMNLVDSDLGLKFLLTQTDTAGLSGRFDLIAYLTDSVDTDIKEILAYYTLSYNELKAT